MTATKVHANANLKEYAIAISLDDKCAKEIGELNIKAARILNHLNNVENHWHITLYHGAYKQENIKQIYDKVKALQFKPFNLELLALSITANRWIDININKTEYLQQLHNDVVELASPYHERPLRRAADIYDSTSTTKRRQIDNYGVSGILELYKPHITLFYQYPPSIDLQKAQKELEKEFRGNVHYCKASKIIIGELGYNGNITKILYSIKP